MGTCFWHSSAVPVPTQCIKSPTACPPPADSKCASPNPVYPALLCPLRPCHLSGLSALLFLLAHSELWPASPCSDVLAVCPQHKAEQKDPLGCTRLELAVSLGNLEPIRILLWHNANMGKESWQGWAGVPVTCFPLGLAGWQGPLGLAWCPPVLQEAFSTGDPEMVQLERDFQRATRRFGRLAGILECLNKLHQVWGRCRGDLVPSPQHRCTL